jgi:hypothetical protein
MRRDVSKITHALGVAEAETTPISGSTTIAEAAAGVTHHLLGLAVTATEAASVSVESGDGDGDGDGDVILSLEVAETNAVVLPATTIGWASTEPGDALEVVAGASVRGCAIYTSTT